MGLLDSEPVARIGNRPCKFGQILSGTLTNVDGLTLEADDIDVLERDRRAGSTDVKLAVKLRSAGFDVSKSVLRDHFRAWCQCPSDAPLLGLQRCAK